MLQAICLTFLTLLGLCVGSFCNVLIYRIPKGEEFVRTHSHCMACGHVLAWYELIPLVSWLVQKGKCRSCGISLSPQYPIVEGLNGGMWLLAGILFWGDALHTALYCALFSLLLVLAVIDWRTFEIPNGLTLAILVLGAIQLAVDWANWPTHLIGMCSVSLLFLALWWLTKGAGLGMGDVKLMAVAGLLLGWPRILLSMLVGSIAGAVIHLIRMRHGAGRKLAFGPYLDAGIWFSALFGQPLIEAYLNLLSL